MREVPPTAGGRAMVPGKVTAIISCFNGERWIRRAVESALEQSYPSREVVVVDDGSSDGSRQVLEQHFGGQPDLHLFFQRENRGIPATKNVGVRRASGEYVAFLEQDDEWHREKLARQVAVLAGDPEVGLVHTAAVYVDPGGLERVLRAPAAVPGGSKRAAVTAIFRRNPITSMSSVAMRRSCLEELGGFDERYSGGDDYDLWLRVAGRYGISYLDEPLVRYRLHPGSFSWSRADRMLRDRLEVIERAVVRYPFLESLRRKRLARVWLSSAVQAFERESGREALRWAAQALRLAPDLPRVYLVLAFILAGGSGRRLLSLWRHATQFRDLQDPKR